MTKQRLMALAVLTGSLALAGCGGAGGGSESEQVQSVSNNPTSGDTNTDGDTNTGGQTDNGDNTNNGGEPDAEPDEEQPDAQQVIAQRFRQHCSSDLTQLDGPELSGFDYVTNLAENEGNEITALRTDVNDPSSTLILNSAGFPNTINSVCSSDGQVYTAADDIADLFDLAISPESGEVTLRVRRNLDFEQNAFYQINYQLADSRQKVLVRVYDVQQGTEQEPLVLSSFNELSSYLDGQFVSDNIGLDVFDIAADIGPCDGRPDKSQACHATGFVALERDIDASETATSPWQTRNFTGTLDGRNHVISNLTTGPNQVFLSAGDNRFTNYRIRHLGLENGTFQQTIFSSIGYSEVSHVYVSGVVKIDAATAYHRLEISPFKVGGYLDSVYTNLSYDLLSFSAENTTTLRLSGVTGSTSVPLRLGAVYSNGAVIGNPDAVFRFEGAGITYRNLNSGFSDEQLGYSAISYQVSDSQEIYAQNQYGIDVPYFSYGGLGSSVTDYPDGEQNNGYAWRYITDRENNIRPVALGNRSRDLNNDGIADQPHERSGPDMTAAALTMAEARIASNFTGVWNNGKFDIKNGEMPVLTDMPYPHRDGASWTSETDPGVAFQRKYFDRYISLESAALEPEDTGDGSGADSGGEGSGSGSDSGSGDSGSGTGNGGTDSGSGSDGDSGNNDGSNSGNDGNEIPAAMNNCVATKTIGEYNNDGPAPDDFACVLTVLENTQTSDLEPHVLRLDYQDDTTEMRLLSSGFPNFIRRVSNHNDLDTMDSAEIAHLFGLRINPLNGEVSLQVNKILDFETDGGFFNIELSLGNQIVDLLVRVVDQQLGTQEEALKISSYGELRSFFDGRFVSDNIGFDHIELQLGEASYDCEASDDQKQNCRGVHIHLDRDIDASTSTQQPWVTATFEGTLDGNRHVISGLSMEFDQLFLRNVARFDRFHIQNLGLADGQFGKTIIEGGGTLSHFFASGEIAVPDFGNSRNNVQPIMVSSGKVDAVYTNIRYDLTAMAAADSGNGRLELSAFTGSTNTPMNLGAGYANGSVVADPERLIALRASGLTVSGFNSGYLTESLFYSAMSYQLPLSQAIRYSDGAQRRIPYIGVGGLISARVQERYAPLPPFDSNYNWRFITDRENNSRSYPIGNVDQDTNNDGIADEFNVYSNGKGMVIAEAGISQEDARKSESFTGLWRNGQFDITEGEFPVLTGMPYPHTEGASWMGAEDPGVLYQRATYNDYISRESSADNQ